MRGSTPLQARRRPPAEGCGGKADGCIAGARQGQGRSGGYRTIIALRAGDRAFFLHCFAKNDRANISDAELRSLREIAAHWLNTSPALIEVELKAGRLLEVKHGK
jgi:hypothetical protein